MWSNHLYVLFVVDGDTEGFVFEWSLMIGLVNILSFSSVFFFFLFVRQATR